MDYTRSSSLLNMPPYLFHGKSMEELGQSWLCTSMELESLKMQTQDEIRRRDEQLSHVKVLLYNAMKERDETNQKCKALEFERLILQQQIHIQEAKNVVVATTPADPLSGISSIEDEHIKAIDSKSSDCDESIVSSPATEPIPILHQQPNMIHTSSTLQSFHNEVMERLLPDTKNHLPLPEKGKLLEAVMNAGPLLQTLLLAGPLPQWRHPPPQLESFEIPPVTISINNNSLISRKRGLIDSDLSPDQQSHKLQKLQYNNTLLHQ